MKIKSIIKSSFWVLILIVLGKLCSFVRDIIISSQFGSTYQTDAYFAANNIPSIIFTAIISSYLVLLIPTYKKIQVQQGIHESNLFVSRILNIFIVLSIPLSVIGFLFIEELIYAVAPGFDVKTMSLAIVLGKILILSFPFSSATTILATISNANNKFFAPHIIPLTSSVFVIVGILLFSDKYGIKTVAVSGVLAFVLQLFIQILISRRHFKYSIKAKFLDKHIKKMTWLIMPVFLSFSIDQINLLINSIICSGLPQGSLSSLNYAQRLQATINGTLSMAVITVIYPIISKLLAQNKYEELTQIMAKSLRGVFFVLFPVIVFLAFHTKDFVTLVYFRGKFNVRALDQTSSVFFYYSINVLFISLREIILRLYYIKNNTKIPFITSAVSLIVNVVLSLILVRYLQVAGLALANLIATLISALILFYLIDKTINISLTINHILILLKKNILPLLLFILYHIWIEIYIDFETIFLPFVLLFLLSLVIYFILLLIFKQKEAIAIFRFIKSKIGLS